MSLLRKNVAALLNAYNMTPANAYVKAVADELKLEHRFDQIGISVWTKSKEPRFIPALGIKASVALGNFMQTYKKGYRKDKIAIEFYKLTDEEITDLFIELPHYMKTIGDPTYQISAEKFLAEKIWQTQYPFKTSVPRKRELNITSKSWDEYLATVPESMREAVAVHRENGMSWEDYKKKITDA